MRATLYLIGFSVLISAAAYAHKQAPETRDSALRAIEACERRNEVSSRECKGFNKHLQTLQDVYSQGDKSVLPTLLRYPYLTDFFDQALISDPDAFLTAVSHLPEEGQHSVKIGIAGMWGIRKERFEAIRTTLMKVPDGAPNHQLARECLAWLETENAEFVVNYFPPQTFIGRAAQFELHWFSRVLRAMNEEAMWPPAPASGRSYRITVVPAFLPPQSVLLRVMPDGAGQIDFRTTDAKTHQLNLDGPHAITTEQVARFIAALDQVQYWQSPTETPLPKTVIVFDATVWFMEGVQDGQYHISRRECLGPTPLGNAAWELFDLAGHATKHPC